METRQTSRTKISQTGRCVYEKGTRNRSEVYLRGADGQAEEPAR